MRGKSFRRHAVKNPRKGIRDEWGGGGRGDGDSK